MNSPGRQPAGEDQTVTVPDVGHRGGRATGVLREEGGATRPLAMALGARYLAGKLDFLGIGLSCLTDERFLAALSEAIRSRSRLAVSFINPDYVIRGHRVPGLIEKINRFDIVLPDGWGVVFGARWIGLPVPDRQGNGDICPKVFAMSAQQGFSVFLFGCGEGVPERAATTLTAAFPGLPVAGTLHGHWDLVRGHPGHYDDDDIDMMVQTINASDADILLVSIPTPMQQAWVWQVASRLTVPVIITGGSYLDHVEGGMNWYPQWIKRMRLCWLYRFAQEPRRLWRRYTLDLLAFEGMVLRAKVGRVLRARELR